MRTQIKYWIVALLIGFFTINLSAKEKVVNVLTKGEFLEIKNTYINIVNNGIFIKINDEINDTIFFETINKKNDIYTIKGKYHSESCIIRAFNKNGMNILMLEINNTVYYLQMKNSNYMKNLF